MKRTARKGTKLRPPVGHPGSAGAPHTRAAARRRKRPGPERRETRRGRGAASHGADSPATGGPADSSAGRWPCACQAGGSARYPRAARSACPAPCACRAIPPRRVRAPDADAAGSPVCPGPSHRPGRQAAAHLAAPRPGAFRAPATVPFVARARCAATTAASDSASHPARAAGIAASAAPQWSRRAGYAHGAAAAPAGRSARSTPRGAAASRSGGQTQRAPAGDAATASTASSRNSQGAQRSRSRTTDLSRTHPSRPAHGGQARRTSGPASLVASQRSPAATPHFARPHRARFSAAAG